MELQSSLFSPTHLESWREHKKIVRTYEKILESEINRANPVLKGHSHGVTGIALTSDNSFLISCGKDNTLRVWSLIDRVQERKHDIQVWPGNFITSMALSPDNNTVILVISDKSLMIMNLETFSTQFNVNETEKVQIKSVSISGDSQHFCTSDSDRTLKIYDMEGIEQQVKKVEDVDLTFVLYVNELVFFGDTSGKLTAWNTWTCDFDFSFDHKSGFPTAGVLCGDNNYLVAGYSTGEVVVWDLLKRTCEDMIKTEKSSPINSISYSCEAGKKTVVASNERRELVFISLNSKKVKKCFVRHSDTISSVIQTKNGKLVISASHDKLIKVWQKGEFRGSKPLTHLGKDIRCTALHTDSNLIAIGYNNASVKLFNLAEDKEKKCLTWKSQSVLTAIWSNDKDQLITSNTTPEIAVFSYEKKNVEFTIPCGSAMKCLKLSPDSKLLYGCSGDNKIFCWDFIQKTVKHEFQTEENSSHHVIAFSPDWAKMYSGGNNVINIWDLASKTIKATLDADKSLIKCLVTLTNCKTLVSGGCGGKVVFWDLEVNEPDFSIEEGTIEARAMDLFKEEKFLVIVYDSPKVKIVDIEKKTVDFEFQASPQYCCKVLNDTTLLMADSENIRFYNLAEKKEEAVIKAHSKSILSLLIDKEKDTLLSFSSDRWIKSWKISDKSQMENYQTYCGSIIALSLSREFLGIATEEGMVLIYSSISTKEVKSLQVHTRPIQSLDYSNGNFATGSNDSRVGFFNMKDLKIHYFEGHTDWVRCVRFSKDSRMVFSASDDKKVKGWNLETKTLEYSLEGHEGYVYSLCIFPSGKFLASCSGDKQVKVWNLEFQKEQCSFENHSNVVYTLCLSSNERFLFSGSEDSTISAFDLNAEKFICSFTDHSLPVKNLAIYNNTLYSMTADEIKTWLIHEKKEIFSFRWNTDSPYHLALSPDEKYLAVAFYEGAVRIYDFSQAKFLPTVQPFASGTSRLAFTRDSKNLLLATPGFNILSWNIQDEEAQELPDTKTMSRNVRFSPDFSLMATFSDDFKAFVWNWDQRKILQCLEGHGAESFVMVFSTDNLFLFVGIVDGSVFKWNLRTLEKYQYREHNAAVKGLAFSLSRKLLISGSHDKKVCFYNIENNDIKTVVNHKDWVRSIAITQNERFAISAGDDKVLIVWNLDTKEESFRLEGHSNYIYGVAISSDNNIYSSSEDKSIILWSLNQRKKIRFLRTVSGSIYCIVLTKDGKKAFTGSDVSLINIFNLESKTETACLSGHTKTVCDLALSEDESLLVSGSWDNSVRVYDTETCEEVAVFKDVHKDYVRSVAITKNKEFVISGSDDRFIFFWNLEKKEKEFTLEGHRNYIYCIRLTDDEKYLISASRDETIILWDIEQKSEAYTFIGHAGAVKCLALFKNSRSFITGGEDKLIKVWSIYEKREDFTLRGHNATITVLKITSDNLRLISGSDDTRIKIWDLEERVIKFSISGNNSSILAVNITENGKLLITAANDKSLKLWKMSEDYQNIDQDEGTKPFVHFHTPDDQFELKYLYGKLYKEVKKGSTSNMLEMGTIDIYDPYYQNMLKFYNLIDNIRGGHFSTLLSTSSNVVFSQFLYTTLHILANNGNSKVLENMNSANIQFKSDYFGKSPLYYAIAKQNQDCVDRLLEFLISISEQNDSSKVQSSYSTISNDLSLIIKNSSKSLHILLRNCLISTPVAFAKIEKELPIYMFTSNFNPITHDFIDNEKLNAEKIPVIMKFTPFTLPCKMGSAECIEFLEAIIECSNNNIYNTHFIQYLLQIQWDQLIYWVFGYTFLLWFNLVFLILLFTEKDNIVYSWKLPIFLFINFLLILWESIQMFIQGFFEYFRDPWNIVDFFRFMLSIVWILMKAFDESGVEIRILAWLVALLNFTRGLTGFRLFNGTRYYVRLILRALKDMGYFIILLSYSTLTFGVMFQVSRNDEALNFKTLWMDSYSLHFGNFEAQDDYNFSYETIAYMLATVINVILMLNLLISILGDSYSNFQEEKVVIDYKEKASVILEIQKIFFWIGKTSENKFFHVMCSYNDNGEEQTTDEKIEDVVAELRKINEDAGNQEKNSKEFNNQIQKLENEMKNRISSVEAKIGEFETKFEMSIGGINGKFNEFNETLNKILESTNRKVKKRKRVKHIDEEKK